MQTKDLPRRLHSYSWFDTNSCVYSCNHDVDNKDVVSIDSQMYQVDDDNDVKDDD